MSDCLIRAAKFAVLVAVAVIVGSGVAVGCALLGHEILVLAVGEDGIPAIDDTLPMFVLVAGTYLAGTVAGLLVFVAGWRRLLRRPRIPGKASARVFPCRAYANVRRVSRGLRPSAKVSSTRAVGSLRMCREELAGHSDKCRRPR